MTKEEAVAKLKELGLQFRLLENRTIRDLCGRCPIVALAEAMEARTYDNCQWAEAADAIGLAYRDAVTLVETADAEMGELRNDLLSLCEGYQ